MKRSPYNVYVLEGDMSKCNTVYIIVYIPERDISNYNSLYC